MTASRYSAASGPGRKFRSSHLGGVPTSVPPAGERIESREQLALPLEGGGAGDGGIGMSDGDGLGLAPVIVRPRSGVVHIRRWLTADEQRGLVAAFRAWALPPAGLRHPRMPAGHVMSIQSVCLGWHWQPYGYSRTADDTDGAPVKPMPPSVIALAKRAVGDADLAQPCDYDPDAAIVNLYTVDAKLGLHQDDEEPSGAPVVTISLGDACIFRLAGVDRRTSPFTDIRLESGDLLVFGGESRRVYHGVPKILAATGPSWLDLPPGRLSVTVRETGLG